MNTMHAVIYGAIVVLACAEVAVGLTETECGTRLTTCGSLYKTNSGSTTRECSKLKPLWDCFNPLLTGCNSAQFIKDNKAAIDNALARWTSCNTTASQTATSKPPCAGGAAPRASIVFVAAIGISALSVLATVYKY